MSDPQAPPPGSFVDPGTGQVTQLGQSVVPSQQRITRNPMLPQHPLGAYTDAQYEAAVAQLRAQTMQKYNDVLRQLGYTDDQGNFVMGSAETDAAQKRSEASYQEDLERQRVTHEMQNAGTLFSGYRGQQEGQRTMPYEQTKAQLGIDLPNQLSSLYENAGNIVSDFVNQHNQLLSDAATRAAAAAINNPGAGGGTAVDPNAGGAVTDPGAVGGGTAPPPGPDAAGVFNPAGAASAAVNVANAAPNSTYAPPPGAVSGAINVANAAPAPAPPPGIISGVVRTARAAPAPTPAPAFDPTALTAAAKAAGRRQFIQQ